MSDNLKSHFEILDLPDDASKRQIHHAYEKLKADFDHSKKESNDVYFMSIVQESYEAIMKTKDDDSEAESEEAGTNSDQELETNPSERTEDSNQTAQLDQSLPITSHDLPLTLDEVFSGCLKAIPIRRKRLDSNGVAQLETKTFSISIKPGIASNATIVFTKEGNQLSNGTVQDLQFIIRDQENAIFKRSGTDVSVVVQVSPKQVDNREEVTVPTIDGKILKVRLADELIQKGTKRFIGRGLPYSGDPKMRGSLVMVFEMVLDAAEVNASEIVQEKPKGPDVVRDLPLTLENIRTGCTKRMKITRGGLIDEEGKERFENQILRIEVVPGTIAGTEYRFSEMGDASPEITPSDIVFVARDKPHVHFIRQGNDIIHNALVTGSEIADGVQVEIPTLEKDKTLKVSTRNLSMSNNVLKFAQQGLPSPIDNGQFNNGDLIVNFEVVSDDLKDEPVIHHLAVSLEQVLLGCTKKVKISKVVRSVDGSEMIESKVITVNIEPGTEAGFQYTFPRHGDCSPGRISADIIILITDKPHGVFKRKLGANIEYNAVVSESKAKQGGQIVVPTLSGQEEVLQFGRIEHNEILKIIGRGLPYFANQKRRGDIWVRFSIVPDDTAKHPKSVSQENNQSETTQSSFNSKVDSLYPRIDEVLKQLYIEECEESTPLSNATLNSYSST